MDVEYIAALMRCYRQLHEKIIELDKTIDWPVCINPIERHQNFVAFMISLEDEDEWARYYKNISRNIEDLINRQAPRDKTKLD